ncbi:MAG: glycerol acyltransferase, partial [Isosphaeraceae bacterium]
LPMAVEYPFWDDRCPEVLVRFGRPLAVESGRVRPAREWSSLVERELEETVDRLAAEALARDASRFSIVIQGTAGVGGVYDMGRRFRAWLGGRAFRPEHAARPADDVDGTRTPPREASPS